MRTTRPVITAPTETRCGVMIRPLATTVWTRSLRTAWRVSTGIPSRKLRKRNPVTPSDKAINAPRDSQRRRLEAEFSVIAILGQQCASGIGIIHDQDRGAAN